MNKEDVLSIYPQAVCRKGTEKFSISTGKRIIGEGRTEEWAWEDAEINVRHERSTADGAKELLIDSIYNDCHLNCKILTLEEILDVIDEAKEVVRKSLSKNPNLKPD